MSTVVDLSPFERDVIDRLARIETHVELGGAKIADIEERLRTVERRQWIFLALASSGLIPLLNKLGLHIPYLP